LIGFWPYFLHEYSSGGISATFELIAGTLIILFTLDFLFLQWHLPEPEVLPDTSSDWSCSRHLFAESGGLPAENAGADGARNIGGDPPFPFDTLPSPVIDDTKVEDEFPDVDIAADKVNPSLPSDSVPFFPRGAPGLVKSSVNG
jgi:hypothetical protein